MLMVVAALGTFAPISCIRQLCLLRILVSARPTYSIGRQPC